jgi:hypothetical protein
VQDDIQQGLTECGNLVSTRVPSALRSISISSTQKTWTKINNLGEYKHSESVVSVFIRTSVRSGESRMKNMESGVD